MSEIYVTPCSNLGNITPELRFGYNKAFNKHNTASLTERFTILETRSPLIVKIYVAHKHRLANFKTRKLCNVPPGVRHKSAPKTNQEEVPSSSHLVRLYFSSFLSFAFTFSLSYFWTKQNGKKHFLVSLLTLFPFPPCPFLFLLAATAKRKLKPNLFLRIHLNIIVKKTNKKTK